MVETKQAVLVVDDDEVFREEVRRRLGHDYEVVEADSGGSGLRTLESTSIHCVLLDYQLPDATGLQVLPDFITKGVPTVMMTSAGNEQVAVDAMKRGARDYLVKDHRLETSLQVAVKDAIKHAARERDEADQRRELEMFASVASHDLKAPLRTIGCFSAFIKEDIQASNTEQALDNCQRVIDGVGRMNRLIDGLREYAALGNTAHPVDRVDLSAVAAEVLDSLSESIDAERVRVEVDELPEVLGDRVALGQLLQNLVTNALKFQADDSSPRVRITARATDDGWQVSVADNGIGIDPRNAKEIFQPFRRLHATSRFDGSGLGLAVCRRIAERHGGRIWVESLPDEGATFHFTIAAAGCASSELPPKRQLQGA